MNHTTHSTARAGGGRAQRGRAGILKGAAALALSLVVGALGMAPALALPPDGPGPETPGTSSRVWPTELSAGDVLNFEVSGFPPNEVVYIKIDDGEACSDTSHGACVYHTQALDANGYATGSLVLPADLAPGDHWLRMLATGDVFDSETGEKLGYEGYTRRGGNDFRIVERAATQTTQGGAVDQGGQAAPADQGGAADTGTGSTGTTSPGSAAPGTDGTVQGGTISLGDGGTAATPGAQTDPNATQAEADAPVAAAHTTDGGSGFPVLGVAVLGGAIVIGGGLLAWALRGRGASSRTTPAA
ncbi:hypothetical protein [Microbacterium sp. No. 7]|uniref:hypothetical protein n=1 Tax=Microbacterium sp. No. 7 TaxID=1714373 RepID=UPI0006D2B336|nr:hypothetical protein [Microbacterium sp. No. 7]